MTGFFDKWEIDILMLNGVKIGYKRKILILLLCGSDESIFLGLLIPNIFWILKKYIFSFYW